MKKTVFLIIITCITVLCILLGAFRHMHISSKSAQRIGRSIERSFDRASRFADDIADDVFEEINENSNDETNWSFADSDNLERFDTISIDGNVMSVSISYGSSYSINTKYIRDWMRPAYKVSGHTLKINQPWYRRKNVANGSCKVFITVPSGVTLDSVDLNINVGGIKVEDVDMEDGVFRTDVGAIALSNVDFENLKIESDVGAVSVELERPASEYSIDVKSDVGGIEVCGAASKRSYSHRGTTDKRIKIKTDVGGIEIK